MPTDGADFGRTRQCYGKAFTMARDGADDADVAACIVRGVERDIRRDGGAPAFPLAANLLVLVCQKGDAGSIQLLAAADAIRRDHVESPITRHLAAAAENIGLSAIAAGRTLTRRDAAESLIAHLAQSRCCDSMTGYIARNRTQDVSASLAIVDSIKSKLAYVAAIPDLASRMLACSLKGLPARATDTVPISHTSEGLDEEI